MTTTFGFEAEFARGAPQLISLLSSRGHARQPEERLHGYHCDCEPCRDLIHTMYRAQRDSSCEGEMISQIFRADDWETAVAAMDALQEAALDVDAIIDTSCGMHVHIGTNNPGDLAEPEILSMAWLGLEPILWEHVAGAAWARRRGSQNNLLTSVILDTMYNDYVWSHNGIYPVMESDFGSLTDSFKREWIAAFRARLLSMGWDRHCDLARANHGGVYELRIFNATRVSWRIELACRLAVALCDPVVAGHFAALTDEFLFGGGISTLTRKMQQLRNGFRLSGRQYSSREERPLQQTLPITLDVFMETVSAFDERLGELLAKQTGYVAARKEVGQVRGAISNEMRTDQWNHDMVLAALAERASVA